MLFRSASSVSAALGVSSFSDEGAGAQSSTSTSQTVSTELGAGSSVVAAGTNGSISLISGLSQAIDSIGDGIAVSASPFSRAGSGVALSNTIGSSSTVALGSGASLSAGNISLEATYGFDKTLYGSNGANANSVAAGAIGGAGITSSTTIGSGTSGNGIAPAGAFINLGENAQLLGSGSLSQPGSLQLQALTSIDAVDTCNLIAYSAGAVVVGTSSITNNAQAQISGASGASLLNPTGTISLSAMGDGLVSASSSALAGEYGLGTSVANASNTPTNSITLNGVTVLGREVQIGSGISPAAVPNQLQALADSQINTLLLGATPSFASATVADSNTITISGGSALQSLGNLVVQAQGTFPTVSGDNPTPGAGQGNQVLQYEQTTARTQSDSTVRLLVAVPIPGDNTTLDTCTNTITISADSQLSAGVQHDLQVWTLPVDRKSTRLNSSHSSVSRMPSSA